MNRKPYRLLVMLMASLLFIGPHSAWPETNQTSEYQVKAAYLYHFAKFVEWPSDTTANVSPTLTVCVLGKSPFGDALNTISGKTVRGRRVVITFIKTIDDLKECDILFVSMSEKAKLGQILNSVASRSILTISDIKGFAAAGGMIGFVSVSDKVRFEINQRASQRSYLRISAQLLKLATIVTE